MIRFCLGVFLLGSVICHVERVESVREERKGGNSMAENLKSKPMGGVKSKGKKGKGTRVNRQIKSDKIVKR